MNENERETHFQGFAKLLFDDLSQLGLVALIDLRNFPDHPDRALEMQAGMVQLTQQIIARRAYDLVDHVLNSLVDDHLGIDYDLHYWPNDQLIDEYIPDLTEWPKE